MKVIPLHLIDPADLDDSDKVADVWSEACSYCGATDNFGEWDCGRCAA